ncbi:uncharacterized protein BCR38DRAFT_517669 [Pseudomassariella vexata]|uniref:Uncharacterized protein n=1 Tax=Pseudomassariella vexata TaxID=1141098 RepID=A0A1Y2DT20_9PEZI|nr:uncharacterized protein BCR38DRAFT_517669 [Pseudomassariella vexata]ORY62294.1 hypothetical protein BCR38DRAFT_517669 [Pseudomassariella vexata]
MFSSPSSEKMVMPATPRKKVETPTKRAVGMFKDTWRKIVKTPKQAVTRLTMSSPPPVLRRPAIPCLDRTKLNDVTDEIDLSIIPSHGNSSFTNSSPTIQDSDWRRFEYTGLASSPSTFLGHHSVSSASGKIRAVAASMGTMDEIPFELLDRRDILGSASDLIIGNDSELEIISDYYGSPKQPSPINSERADKMPEGMSAIRVRSASEPPQRTTATEDELCQMLSDVKMRDVNLVTEPNPEAEHDDRWSFVSVCNSTEYDLKHNPDVEMPANKRRKIAGEATEMDEQAETPSPRDHPRYSGIYSLDPTPNRRISFYLPHGPAVVMPSSPQGTE